MKNHSFFFLILLIGLISLPLVIAAPVADLNLTVVNPPATPLKDLNFQAAWTPQDANVQYWDFDGDGNVLVSAFDQNTIIDQNFDAGTFADWTVQLGSWSAASNALVNTTAGNSKISIPQGIDLTLNDMTWQFVANSPLGTSYFVIVAGTGATFNQNTEPGYNFFVNSSGQSFFRFHDGAGNNTTLITGSAGDLNAGVDANVTITRTTVGTWELFVNDVSKGTDLNTSFTASNFFWLDFREVDQSIDDVFIFDTIITPFNSPQFQSHTFATAGAKRIVVTIQNFDGNSTAFLDLNLGGTLDITVFDENTGTTISGASVDFNAGTYITGTDGNLSIPLANLTTGEFTITVDVNVDYPQRQFIFDLNSLV